MCRSVPSTRTLPNWPIRHIFLNEVLPAPVDKVEPADLKDFKDENRAPLVRLRLDIERRAIAAAAIDNPTLNGRELDRSRRELRAQLDEVCALMAKRNWRRIGFGALGVVGGGILVADAITTGGALSIGGNSLGLASAVYASFDGKRTREQILGHPLAYAALAHHAAERATPFHRSALSRVAARIRHH